MAEATINVVQLRYDSSRVDPPSGRDAEDELCFRFVRELSTLRFFRLLLAKEDIKALENSRAFMTFSLIIWFPSEEPGEPIYPPPPPAGWIER
jgi:hypothetical protein